MKRILALSLTTVAALLGGCQHSHVAPPLATNYPPADVSAEMEFWHTLADARLTSNDEALHGLIILANKSDESKTYDDRIKWMIEHGYLPSGWNAPADDAVERGTVARILTGIMKIEGGLSMHILGSHPRYSTRELVYMNLMPPSTPQQGIAGIDFVGMIAKAESYMERPL
jgi:hypothetical protein